MKAIVAKTCGYCFGVKRALDLTEKTLKKYKNKKIFSIGQIIHNKGVIKTLCDKGLIIAEGEDNIEPGSIFIVRSHGMSPDLLKRIESKGVIIIDTVCPFVKRAQSKAKMLSRKGYHLVIIGNQKHPEVISVIEHADKNNLTVIEKPEELAKIKKHKKIGVIMQTTQMKSNAKSIVAGLLDKAKEILIENTICEVTEDRQHITGELAKKVDVMLIVGGKNSANTSHLAKIAKELNTRTYHIENYTEIKPEWFDDKNTTVGISGGASTPDSDINAVKHYIEDFIFPDIE
ncbi:MAG: 4-hydroxy-3-methylbut-2-enyl diphosphate reductase [Actinobacteria bacterium]|nr:4-hydroxy-3-methylbut-2-enyl diphosphate reductase [Actinomycetota bacterium]